MWTYTVSAPRTFTALEAPDLDASTVAPGHVLLRPLAGGICGSDIPFYRGRISPVHEDVNAGSEAIPGFSLHEVAGEVVAAPGGEFGPGDRVVGWAERSDGLAERVVTSANSVVAHDPSLDPVEAVVLQPLACVLHTVGRLPDVTGRRVAVIGLGPIGLLFAHALKSAGARHVVGIDPVDRSRVAATFGIDELVRTTSDRWARALTEQERPDVVVEVVGHQVGTLVDAIEAVRPGGTIFYFGVPDDLVYPVPMYDLFRKTLTLLTGAVPDRRAALEKANRYAAQHPALLKELVTDVYDVHDVAAAYARADICAPDRLKVVLTYPGLSSATPSSVASTDSS